MNLGMISTLRPDLLGQTLASFGEHALAKDGIGEVFVNLDRAFGDEDDLAACQKLILDRFPQAVINVPDEPGFTRAVQWVWSSVPDGPFLYLEDDWICLRDIDLDEAASLLVDGTTMVPFLTREHGTKGRRDFSLQNDRPRLFGFPIGPARRWAPAFATSPGIIDAEFARTAASLMDPALDPEKQMRFGENEPLMEFVTPFRCRFFKAPDGSPLIKDIGRDWHDARGSKKVTSGAKTHWE